MELFLLCFILFVSIYPYVLFLKILRLLIKALKKYISEDR